MYEIYYYNRKNDEEVFVMGYDNAEAAFNFVNYLMVENTEFFGYSQEYVVVKSAETPDFGILDPYLPMLVSKNVRFIAKH